MPAQKEHENTDFIKSNALEIIHKQSPVVSAEQPRSIDKPDYGKVPEYLKEAKLKLQQEKAAKEEQEKMRIQQVSLPSKLQKGP